jgi:hypothetical protein
MNSVYVVYEIINQPYFPLQPLPTYPLGSLGPQVPNPLHSIDLPSNSLTPLPYIQKPYTGPSIKIICICKNIDTASYYCSQSPYRQLVGPIGIIN